jgi:hypothetical protein
MAKGKLFEYAVLYHPKGKKNAAGESVEEKKSEVIADVTRVLAGSDAEVSILAARSIPETFLSRLDDVEIVVRPF